MCVHIQNIYGCYRPPLPPLLPPPLPPVVPCGVGSPLPLPAVVAVGCAPFSGYCWFGVRLLRVWTLECDTVALNSEHINVIVHNIIAIILI